MSAALQKSDPEDHGCSPIRIGQAGMIREALTRNISRDTAARLGYLLTRVLIPPFVLSHLGLGTYSIWSAMFILVSYVGVTTMGVSAVYIKYTAEFCARGETEQTNSLLSTGLFVTGAICLVLYSAFWLELNSILIWLRIPAHLLIEAHTAALMVMGIVLCGLVLSIFELALVGSHKIAETQGVWVVCYLTEMGLIFYLIGTGHGLIGLAEAFLVRQTLSITLNTVLAFRMLPWLRIAPWRFSRDSLRKLTGFGGVVQLSALLSIALSTIERVIAAPLVGLSAIGIMDLSDKWPTMSSVITDAFPTSFLPAASHLKSGEAETPFGNSQVVVQLYLRGARYMCLVSSSICALMATTSASLLTVWLGTNHPASAYLMTIFALQQTVHQMTAPGTSIFKGIGRPKEEFYYSVPNILFTITVVPLSRLVLGHWSLIGLGSSVVIATVASAVVFIVHANKILGVSSRRYLGTVVVPGLVPYLIGMSVAFPAWRLTEQVTRWHALAVMAGISIVYTLALAIAVDHLVLESDERSWFRSVIRSESSRMLGAIGFGESDERTA
jgi:O-antigen/teichoic acid export membrane protein